MVFPAFFRPFFSGISIMTAPASSRPLILVSTDLFGDPVREGIRRQYLDAVIDAGGLPVQVPVGLDERIRRLLPAIGYEMNMFVSIALMRRVNEVADYEDDEQERFGEEYE